MLGGRATSHNRTAIAHTMSYPLTAYFGLPHGLACSFTIPAIFRTYKIGQEILGHGLDIVQETVTLLESLKLGQKAFEWVDANGIYKLLPMMNMGDGFANFVFNINHKNIMRIVTEALRLGSTPP